MKSKVKLSEVVAGAMTLGLIHSLYESMMRTNKIVREAADVAAGKRLASYNAVKRGRLKAHAVTGGIGNKVRLCMKMHHRSLFPPNILILTFYERRLAIICSIDLFFSPRIPGGMGEG